jgi:hypothetical protein
MKILWILILAGAAVGCGQKPSQPNEPPAMNRELLLQKLQPSTNTYAVWFRKASQSLATPIPSRFLTKHDLLRCLLLDPGWDEHNFIVAINRASGAALILTDSLAAYNTVYQAEGLNPTNATEALAIALEAMELTRPLYRSFQVLTNSAALEQRASVSGQGLGGLQIKEPRLETLAGGKFTGDTYLVLGRDVVKRTIELSREGVSFTDSLLARGAARPLTPHE